MDQANISAHAARSNFNGPHGVNQSNVLQVIHSYLYHIYIISINTTSSRNSSLIFNAQVTPRIRPCLVEKLHVLTESAGCIYHHTRVPTAILFVVPSVQCKQYCYWPLLTTQNCNEICVTLKRATKLWL